MITILFGAAYILFRLLAYLSCVDDKIMVNAFATSFALLACLNADNWLLETLWALCFVFTLYTTIIDIVQDES